LKPLRDAQLIRAPRKDFEAGAKRHLGLGSLNTITRSGESSIMSKRNLALAALAAAIAVGSFAAQASHSWGNYHWARTTSSFNLQTLDSTVNGGTNANWPALLGIAVNEWSQSNSLNLVLSSYDKSSNGRRKCSAVPGKIRVCNQAYGKNGWLGLASINIDANSHITQGTAKMNDSYAYVYAGDVNEARHVMCQEVGHTFGLGHTSEDGTSQNTCMDYSSSPTSVSPNSHDYQQLTTIYQHLDSYNTYSTTSAVTPAEANSMAGEVPMGHLVHRGYFEETWVAPDNKGGLWVHHVVLAPGFEHAPGE
jgi:hypothetical protein